MIHIYGDSHGIFCFQNLELEHQNHAQPSITMHRIGRDNSIVNFHESHQSANSIFILTYGEVDCRCHIGRQRKNNRELFDICNELVSKYMNTIKNNIKVYKHIIVCAIVPPTSQPWYEAIHGPITHEFPFIDSDSERIQYTELMNSLLKDACEAHGFIFFNPFDFYKTPEGVLRPELSDGNVHIRENKHFLDELINLINTL